MADALVAYCRAGFEAETAADLRRAAAYARSAIDVTAGEAYVTAGWDSQVDWSRALAAAPPIFARSAFAGTGPVPLLQQQSPRIRADRVTPILGAVAGSARAPWASVWVEFPDTNEGKQLSGLARAIAVRLEDALRGSLRETAARRLHVFLPDGAHAFVGESDVASNRWPMGIARLRMPPGAPSRSTLKLAEAFAVFLGDRERTLLRPGMRAVDLGAAPGGWTWQLVQRGIAVAAVDNGPLAASLMRDRLVTHVREDAFRFRPRRPVDWLVCDVVEQPVRIAELVAHWIADGLARRAIFNLKLPMKKRYDEVRSCMQRMGEVVGGTHTLAVRHLYHDREEVTGYLARSD